MRSHSVGCGMASRVRAAMRLAYAKFFSRCHDAVMRVYHEAGNMIETHEQAADFKKWCIFPRADGLLLGNVVRIDGIIPHISGYA